MDKLEELKELLRKKAEFESTLEGTGTVAEEEKSLMENANYNELYNAVFDEEAREYLETLNKEEK